MSSKQRGADSLATLDVFGEADPAVVKCGMAVEAVFEKQTDDVTIALFQPAN